MPDSSTILDVTLRGFPGGKKELEWLFSQRKLYICILHVESLISRSEKTRPELQAKAARMWKAFYSLYKRLFTPYHDIWLHHCEHSVLSNNCSCEELYIDKLLTMSTFDFASNEQDFKVWYRRHIHPTTLEIACPPKLLTPGQDAPQRPASLATSQHRNITRPIPGVQVHRTRTIDCFFPVRKSPFNQAQQAPSRRRSGA